MRPDSDLLDIAQAAAFLSVSEASLRRWTNRGLLTCLRIGGRRERRFRRADLLAFLESPPTGALTGHLCGFYSSDTARAHQMAQLLRTGLGAGSVCLLAAGLEVRERVLAEPGRRRPSLRRAVDDGRLMVTEYADGRAAQLRYWEVQFAALIRKGVRSIQVIGDVSGSGLARDNGFEQVLAYEAAYERLSRRFLVSTVCLYDARRHSGQETAALLAQHPDFSRHPVAQLVS